MTSVTPRLSIVIPAFNEAGRIGQTIETLLAHVGAFAPDFEIRVVDDGSTDATTDIVETLGKQDARVVLQRERHRGKGGTVRAGLMAARGELRFMCDADLSMPVSELPRFLEAVPGRCEIAVATREGEGASRIGEPENRHTLGRGFNALVRTALLPGLNDTQCGFKMFTARAVETIFPRVTIEGWAFDVEVLVIARRHGLAVREVPIEWHYRELSRVSAVRDSVRMMRDVLRIKLNAMRGIYG